MDIVGNQVRDNTPPETRPTLERLVAAGHTSEDARRLVGCVVSTAIDDVLAQHRPFDEAAYVAALQRLPVVPWAEEPAELLRSPGVQHSTPKPRDPLCLATAR